MQCKAALFWLGLLMLLLCPDAFAADAQNSLSSEARAQSRSVFGYDPTSDFVAFDPSYRQKHAKYAHELRALQLELARQAALGRATPCSRPILLEARWLLL